MLYYIRGSYLCAAIVQFYCTYSLYYLVLRLTSDLCALYLYYFDFKTTNTLHPCSTDAIGAIHHIPQPPAPQEPMVALPFRRLLTSVHPTPVPPTPHPVHPPYPSHPSSNQPAHKIQCFLIRYNPIQTIRYNPAENMIQSS